jgi:hypothetical protein
MWNWNFASKRVQTNGPTLVSLAYLAGGWGTGRQRFYGAKNRAADCELTSYAAILKSNTLQRYLDPPRTPGDELIGTDPPQE